jgi:hypothetical protein
MATFENDEKLWYEAWLNTPLWMQPGATSPTEAMKRPACCVKHRRGAGESPLTGVLVSFDEASVVVRGHGDATSAKFVWRGTVAEYFGYWDCD